VFGAYKWVVLSLLLATTLSVVPIATGPAPGAHVEVAESVPLSPAVPQAPLEEGEFGVRATGTVLVGRGLNGTYVVRRRGHEGEPVATLTLRSDRQVSLELKPGMYSLSGGGAPEQSFEVLARTTLRIGDDPQAPPNFEVEVDEQALETIAPAPDEARRARPWVSPLLSAIIPGFGQFRNREGGKGAAILIGMVGMGLGVSSLEATVSTAGSATSFRSVAGRLGGIATLSGAMHLFYVWQILEAYRTATNSEPDSFRDHRVDLQLTRLATVGRAVGDRPALMTDWNVSVMGQVAPRFSVGVSDLGIQVSKDVTTSQAGLRLGYRLVELRRLWIGAALGAAAQWTWSTARDRGLKDSIAFDANRSRLERQFGVTPYAQAEFRWFPVDRWSINVMPRVSVPLVGPRHYGAGDTVARYATTFEIGSGVGVYF